MDTDPEDLSFKPELQIVHDFVGFALRPCSRMNIINNAEMLKEEEYEPVYLVRGTFSINRRNWRERDEPVDGSSSDSDGGESDWIETRW
eukprot:834548-Prymnesium_polylepis.1